MSTIGEKVQLMPSALASLADTSPTFFIASVSHEQERARGIGNIVS
ncbi:Uncharacterised protein [Segatella copri]|nr:Uncharacterised protein [Segatella copri]